MVTMVTGDGNSSGNGDDDGDVSSDGNGCGDAGVSDGSSNGDRGGADNVTGVSAGESDGDSNGGDGGRDGEIAVVEMSGREGSLKRKTGNKQNKMNQNMYDFFFNRDED